jgi:hypothetical protein
VVTAVTELVEDWLILVAVAADLVAVVVGYSSSMIRFLVLQLLMHLMPLVATAATVVTDSV